MVLYGCIRSTDDLLNLLLLLHCEIDDPMYDHLRVYTRGYKRLGIRCILYEYMNDTNALQLYVNHHQLLVSSVVTNQHSHQSITYNICTAVYRMRQFTIVNSL